MADPMLFAGRPMSVRNDADVRICQEVLERNAYEKPQLGFRPLPGELWIDCGANIGAFSVWASTRKAETIAIEASRENWAMAKMNLEANGCTTDLMHGCVSSGPGITIFRFNAKTPGRSSALAQRGRPEYVPNVPLNSLIAERKPQGLKIDIEGGEFDLLDAGLNLEGVRALAFEYHFRFDKDCRKARDRIAPLLTHFERSSVPRPVLEKDAWPSWVDAMMFFWNP